MSSDTDNTPSPRTRLIVDNGGYSRSERIREVEKLLLYAPDSGGFTSYTAYHPVLFQVNTPIYLQTYVGYLNRLTDGSYTSGFLSAAKESTLTITPPDQPYVDHLRVFPYCTIASIYG